MENVDNSIIKNKDNLMAKNADIWTKKNKILIGLTGQTGAGKTTVADLFRQKGIYVVDCDKVAREVIPIADRRKMAEIVFSDKSKLDEFNKINFPKIISAVDKLIEGKNIAIVDASQLFESGYNAKCDYIISVIADEKTRLKRITKRDGITQEQAILRMNSQLPQDYFITHSDFVIDNNINLSSEDYAVLSEKINNLKEKIHEKLNNRVQKCS
jgi:dephospho-CoA kinase